MMAKEKTSRVNDSVTAQPKNLQSRSSSTIGAKHGENQEGIQKRCLQPLVRVVPPRQEKKEEKP